MFIDEKNKAETLWDLEEQTIGKHEILKGYLSGWIPKLGSWNGRILLVDGFAGPGEYAQGEPGSPQIMIRTVIDHKFRSVFSNSEIRCLFYEKENNRASYLNGVVSSIEIPKDLKLHIDVVKENFASKFQLELDRLAGSGKVLAPAFVMIDPFGVKDSPMSLIENILSFSKCECFISFMYEPIRRFHTQPVFESHLNNLFGSEEWQACKDIESSGEKKTFLHNLFRRRLKEAGAKYVLSIELWNGNRHVYTLYFATNHLSGCSLMKETIWKIVPDGSFQFKGRNNNQEQLLGPQDFDFTQLGDELRAYFGTNQWTPIEHIDRFIESDETIFYKGQLRRCTLAKLEKNGGIKVQRPNCSRGFRAGVGVQVLFF